MMESTQVLECTQVLDSHSGNVEEGTETPVKVATLTIDGVDHTIWNRENTIGRDAKCSIVLNSKAVSVEHAVIEADLLGGHFICDLGSTNKTKVGDLQLKPRVKYFINDGVSVKIANLKGLYRHVNTATDLIPPESSTPPTAELTAIPESPERKEEEEDAVASIIAETPCKDESNGADSSDGDIFGETSDSSAIFVRPLKLSSDDTKLPGESETNSGELKKSEGSGGAERVGSHRLEDTKKDASINAAASQSIMGDQSSVLKGDEAIDESSVPDAESSVRDANSSVREADSSVCDADSSDLVVGSQPMLTPEERLYNPKVFECDTVAPGDKLTDAPKVCDQWENIDDSIDEISDQMDNIDSLVENNELQVTFTPTKRNTKMHDIGETGSTCKTYGHVEADNPKIGQKLMDSVVPGSDEKQLSVYELATQEMVDVSNMKIVGATVADSSVDESTDVVVGSQPMGNPSKSGEEENTFDVDTVPMECAVNDRGLSKLDVFDVATRQVHSVGDMGQYKRRDNPSIYDEATQPFAVSDSKINEVSVEQTLGNSAKDDLTAKVTDHEIADVSISDLPTQAVPSTVEPPHGESADHKRGPVLGNTAMENCDVSISDMATQAVSVVKTNRVVSSIHETSISDMPTQAVQKNQKVELPIEEEDPCDSLSDVATQQVTVHRSVQEEVSAPRDVNSSNQSVQPSRVTSESKCEVPNAINAAQKYENENHDSEDIYNVMTQLPVENSHIVLEESNTQLIQSDVQIASHDVSLASKLTQPGKVKSDDMSEAHVADVSLSDLPTQAAVAENDRSTPAKTLKNNTERMMDQDTEDIFNVMTQLPLSKDEILLEAPNTQLLNSEVEKATLDLSLSDMMTQPTKSTSGDKRESPIADMSISDLPTQAAAAKIDRVEDQDSEDIYNVMTQMPVENERILLDESGTQQINTDLENSELKMVECALKQVSGDCIDKKAPDSVPVSSACSKTMESLEKTKNHEIQFRIPTPKKDPRKVEDRKKDNMDVYMMDTEPMDFQGTSCNSNSINDRVANEENAPTIKVPLAVPHAGDSASELSISALATQEATNVLPIDPVIGNDVDDDIFEVDTVPITDQGKSITDAPENTPKVAGGTICSVVTEDDVLAKSPEKETDSTISEHRVVPSPQEIDPNSVEGRIRAMSDKNVNSFATQHIVVSNTKSTVAELLETLEDTSSQVVRINKKVKRLEYSDSEDSNSPVIRVQTKCKTLAESENEEDTNSPLIAPKKPCLPLNDTQEEGESLQGELEKDENKPEIRSDIICNGNDKHSSTSAQKDTHNVIASPLANESSKNIMADPLNADISSNSVETKKATSDSGSRTSGSSEVVKGSVTVAEKVDAVNMDSGQPAEIENTDSFKTASSRVAENLTVEEEEISVVGKSTINNTRESKSLQLQISADAPLNKSNVGSAPTTPEKQTDAATTVTPSTHKQNKLAKVSSEEEISIVGKSTINSTRESESLQLQISADAPLNKSNVVSAPTTPEKQTDAAATVTPSSHEQNKLAKVSPETPEIPKDFFGTPLFHDKPIRQYVNRKKLSLSSTSLLKSPNASSTPKSDVDSLSVIEMEETLQSAVKIRKVDEKDIEERIVDVGYNTLNVKKFKKTSAQKRKSPDIVEQHSQESDVFSSQELGSQDFGRGKRKKLKKNFFGFDDNEELDSFTIKSSRTDLGSVQDIRQSERRSTSVSPATVSLTDEINMNSGEKAGCEKNSSNEAPVKRSHESKPISSDSSSLKKVRLTSDFEGENRMSNSGSNDMELTCVSSRLQEDVGGTAINVKKFRRASPRKLEPVSVEVIPKNESDVKSAKSDETVDKARGRRRNMSTSESDSGKEMCGPHTKTPVSSKSPSTSGPASSSTSPTKSLRSRKRGDTKGDTNSETKSVSSTQKSKRNRVEGTVRDSQEISDPMEEGDSSQEISIKNMSKRLQGALKSNMKLEEEKNNQNLNQRGRSLRTVGGKHTQPQEDVHDGDGNAGKESVEVGVSRPVAKRVGRKCPATEELVDVSSSTHEDLPSSLVSSPKKEVKRRGRSRKLDSQDEQTLEKAEVAEESIPNLEPNKSTARVPTRRGRRKLVTDSITISDTETQHPASSQEVSAPKRGKKAKTDNPVSATKDAADNKSEVTELSDSQNAPSTSKSKTRQRARNTPTIVDDSSAFETDQDSQSQDLSQGRRSGRARKKKESFDEIMSRKEEELKLKKLLRNSAFSPSSDKSRSTSRASVASSSKTEDDGAVMSAPRRQGRAKKSASVTPASAVLSIDEDATFTLPSSPAGSNSSRRKTPRPGSASSSHSVDSQASTRKKQESQNLMSTATVKVMFTGLADSKLSSMVKKLGGKVVEKPADCTVLVTEKVRRTVKFLCALGLGKPIVSPNWLSKSKAYNKFSDPNESLLKDSEAEGKFDFQLNASLEKAQNSRLLEGYSFYATPSVLPPPAEIKPIVECSGGSYLAKPPAKWPSNAAIISCPKDKSGWTKLTKHGILPPILSAEALLSGVLQQRFDLGKHRLK